ncbi:sugar ABC transporter substrate-binding protein [uncultured Cohaesibacter sp.]|uniref:ABC transporter substrate-binding protein n=1 Tax=uncultured Cohaesibacter sp. TaxID=1002546 RepID=UPI0029C640D1|nr:sugar ABC transporter substrate-binding protein [uncultured Cohaesibacter sp.]
MVVNFLSANQPENYSALIPAFEAANPDIKINFTRLPFDELNAAIEARVGGGDETIDIFEADTPRIPALASRGYLTELESYRSQIEGIARSPVDVEQVSYDGKIYAFPLWNSTQLLYYNRDLLKKAGIDALSTDQKDRLTWKELLDLAAKTQKSGAKWGLLFQQVDRYYQLQPLFESNGAGSGLTGEGNLTPDVTNEKWIEAAQWYQDLYNKDISPRGVKADQTDAMFQNGEVAFFVGGPWRLTAFNETKGLNYGVAAHPYFEGGKPVTPTGSWSLALNPHAAHKEAALKFLEFASLSAEGNLLSVENKPLLPVNKDAYTKSVEKLSSMTGKIGNVIDIINYETGETSVGRPRSTGYVAFESVMNRAFSDIRNGEDVKEVLEDAQTQLTSQLSRMR